jgi:hypothetical protein
LIQTGIDSYSLTAPYFGHCAPLNHSLSQKHFGAQIHSAHFSDAVIFRQPDVLAMRCTVKSMFTKKATKISNLQSKHQIDSEDFVIFCGLLRKYELFDISV